MSLSLDGAGLVHPNGHRALHRVSLSLASGARAAVEKRLESLVEGAILALDGPGLSKAGTGCLIGAASALTRR